MKHFQSPKNRFQRALAITRWLSVAIILALVTVRYIIPAFEGESVTVRGGSRELPDRPPELPSEDYLPSEEFVEPNARALAGISRNLIADPYDRRVAVRDLRSFIGQPERYFGDLHTYLILRTAYWQLRRDPDPHGSVAVADLIWSLAQDMDGATRIRSARAEERDSPSPD